MTKKLYRIEIETQTEPDWKQIGGGTRGWQTGMLSAISSNVVSFKRSYTDMLTEKEATFLRLKGAILKEVSSKSSDWKCTIYKSR